MIRQLAGLTAMRYRCQPRPWVSGPKNSRPEAATGVISGMVISAPTPSTQHVKAITAPSVLWMSKLGLILDALQHRGWLDNTLVLYFSDHGDMLGDHNLWRKTYPYESSSKVPLILRWPAGLGQRSRGVAIQNPVELRDVLPTLADAAQAPIPAQVEGESLPQTRPQSRC